MSDAKSITKELKNDRNRKIEQVQVLLKEIDLIDQVITKMDNFQEKAEKQPEFDEDPE